MIRHARRRRGGCAPYPDVFERTLIPSPLTGGGSGAFVTASVIASDGVARVEALLATVGECMYVKHFVDRRYRGVWVSGTGPTWTEQPLQLGSQVRPARFISGRIRSDEKKVRIRFADGSATAVVATRGYVPWAAPKQHLDEPTGAVAAEGLNADGRVVGSQSFTPPKR